jgi:ABC-type multidrug transport system fused ATPase/permease subunit
VLELARREANASGIFFGSTTWSGNLTLLALLGYGQNLPLNTNAMLNRWVHQVVRLSSLGEISVGDLSTLLLYTAYVGSGLRMLTYEMRSVIFYSC